MDSVVFSVDGYTICVSVSPQCEHMYWIEGEMGDDGAALIEATSPTRVRVPVAEDASTPFFGKLMNPTCVVQRSSVVVV